MSKTVAKVWTFGSKSNPGKDPYETLQYSDGSTSCNCRGWCIAKGGVRTCRHTQAVEAGTADSLALSHTGYEPQAAAKQAPKYAQQVEVKTAVKVKPVPARKVQWK
jgi:hypothetical protein